MFCLFSNSSSTHHQHYRLFQDIGAAVRDTAGRRAWRLCGWAESRSHRDLQRDKHHNNTQLTNRPTTSWLSLELSDACDSHLWRHFHWSPAWLFPTGAPGFSQVSLTWLCTWTREEDTRTDQFWIEGNPLCCSVCPFCFFTCVFWVSAW